jgi:tetratricopeptide (TPR) repeat protein
MSMRRVGFAALGDLWSILAALVYVMAASPALAGPFDDAMAAFEKGDYATALKLFQPLADQGDAGAETQLGLMYDLGLGASQDYAQAMSLFHKAADQGDANAQENLGEMYFFGNGVAPDYALAAKWYLRAANQGDAIALYKLGLMYAKGQGVPQDNVQAYRWLSQAVPRYPAGKDRDDATTALNVVAKNMTPAEIAEAQKPMPAVLDGDIIGTWEIQVNGGRWVWEIDPDSTYKFHSEAPDGAPPHSGAFSASGGHWSLQATNGYSDSGTYTVQALDSLVITGRLGTGTWHRSRSATNN